MLCRIVVGLGMGGEWASGAALVAETWPGPNRGKALALVQSSWAVGYGVAAAVVALVMPHFGWRAVFFVGVLPALASLWMRLGVREPEVWKRMRTQAELSTDKPPGLFTRLRRSGPGAASFRRGLLVCAGMNAATLFGWWGLFNWVPHFLALPVALGGRGLSVLQTSGWTMLMQAGAFCGYVIFGYIADRLNPRATYIGYLLAAALVVPAFALVRDTRLLLVLGPLVGFFGTGYFSGFALIASRQFPTAVRGSAMGLAYNGGRVVSAAAPYLVGRISERSGIAFALSLTSAAFLAAALIAALLRPPQGSATVEV
jgi:MFS family permease